MFLGGKTMDTDLDYRKANRIKELRLSQGKTLKQVADSIGITDGQLSLYENGKRAPRNKHIWIELANFFNVPVDYLMGINEQPKESVKNESKGNLFRLEKKEQVIKQIANTDSQYFSEFSNFYKLITELMIVQLDEQGEDFEYLYSLIHDILEYSILLAKESVIREETDREKQKKLEKKLYGTLSRIQANEVRGTLYAKLGALFD